ncbi:MAG TPA: hypothetical protein VL992_15760 [Tepidisphaeraceae bacterium]|nr:hypothetical protein [Tepidisphaeraceae bacterium]
MRTSLTYCAVGLIGLLAIGCEGTVSLIPDADPNLRQPPAVFAADAAKRHYEADAQKIPDKDFRAQYALIVHQVDLANISSQDWHDVEVWINGTYVLHIPYFEKKSDKTLYFTMFYDQNGHHFDTNYGQNPIKKIEVFRGGAMYSVVDHVAD